MSATHYLAGLRRTEDGRIRTALLASRGISGAAEVRLVRDSEDGVFLSAKTAKRLTAIVDYLEGEDFAAEVAKAKAKAKAAKTA